MCVWRKRPQVVGGPGGRGFREESPLSLAGFITLRASRGKREYRHTWTHVYLVFMGSELGSPSHILSYSSQKSNPVFPHYIFSTVSFFTLSLTLLYYFFWLSPLPSIYLSRSPRLSPGRPPFRLRGVCQVPNPWAERSKADKETGDLLFYSGKAKKKMESLIDWDIAFLPFSPPAVLSLIQSSSLALVSFPFCQSFPCPIPISVVSGLKHI